MGIKYELTAKTGTYTDKDGNEKTRYARCGVVLEGKDGRLSIKVESLPVAFDGWLNCWEPEKKDAKPTTSKRTAKPADYSDEIPF